MEIKLDLEGDVKGVSLVQMPTGTGKTTTLTCLRAALTGEAQAWSPECIASFAPQGKSDVRGEFEVRLLFDDRRLTFAMTLDFPSSQVRYATTYARGRNDKYDPPPELRRFLTPYFVRLLIFDGELPQQLLDRTVTRAEEALDAFFQTYLLDELGEAIDTVWQKATQDKTAVKKKGLTRRQNRVESARRRIRKLKQERREAEERRDALIGSVEDLEAEEKRYVQQTEELREKREAFEQEKIIAARRLDSELRDLMDQMRLPHRILPGFGAALSTLRDQLDRLRLPESTSAQFFEELAQEDECVCGRLLDKETRRVIKERASQYMGVDIYGVINSLKTDITRYGEGTLERSTEEISNSVKHLTHKRDGAQSQISALSQSLIDQGDEEMRQISKKLEERREELSKLERLLGELTRDRLATDDESCKCIDWWEHELEGAERLLSEITDTLALRRHRDILQRILSKARRAANSRLAVSVVAEMNERLDTLLSGHGIQVAEINRSLVLERQGGASQGQTLAVGYSFLTTLFERGQHQFPFLVDAPVTALDSRVRREVGNVIPMVCSQFVALVLDTEREGFVEELVKGADGDVLFVTAFEDSPRNSALARNLPDAGVTRKDGSVVVVGRDYFESASFPDDPSESREGG